MEHSFNSIEYHELSDVDDKGVAVQKPMICPVCAALQEGSVKDRRMFLGSNAEKYIVVSNSCSLCKGIYLEAYRVITNRKEVSFLGFLPSPSPSHDEDVLIEKSPRFFGIYNQSLRAESNGDIELAAAGFKNALEVLIKDYAINELGAEEKDIAKKSLSDCIVEFLDSELEKSADVVRVLSNDYTHYKRKYSNHDFAVLKKCVLIFIGQMRFKYRMKYPPSELQNHQD